MEKWKESAKRYITFLDIMGFKDYVYRNRHDIVKERMELLQDTVKKVEQDIKKLSKEINKIDDAIKSVIFSDSILLITKDNSKIALENILFASQLFLTEMIENRIPIKGAISCGMITTDFNKSLFFGQALIDAYILTEELNMYGVILDHNVERKLPSIGKNIESYCSKCKIPMKSGLITHYAINWILFLDMKLNYHKEKVLYHSKPKLALPIIESFYKDISGPPRKYLDNTIDFIQTVFKTEQAAIPIEK